MEAKRLTLMEQYVTACRRNFDIDIDIIDILLISFDDHTSTIYQKFSKKLESHHTCQVN